MAASIDHPHTCPAHLPSRAPHLHVSLRCAPHSRLAPLAGVRRAAPPASPPLALPARRSYCIGLFLAPIFQSLCESHMNWILNVTGTRLRNALMAAIYRKCLRLSNAALQSESNGKVRGGGGSAGWQRRRRPRRRRQWRQCGSSSGGGSGGSAAAAAAAACPAGLGPGSSACLLNRRPQAPARAAQPSTQHAPAAQLQQQLQPPRRAGTGPAPLTRRAPSLPPALPAGGHAHV
jgi:hypothetical protein